MLWEQFENKLRLQGNSENTIKSYKTHYNNMNKYTKGLTEDNVQQIDFVDFVMRYPSNNTKVHFRTFINVFDKLLELGLDLKPLNDLRFVRERAERNIPTEVDSIVEGIKDTTDKLIVKMLSETGVRVSELANIEMNNIDFDNGIIKLVNTKTRRNRVVAVKQDTLGLMKQYLGIRKPHDKYFFVSNKGNRFSTDALRNRVKKYTDYTPHSFRHYFATEKIVEQGIDIATVAKALGHTTPVTTLNSYTHVADRNVIEMMRR